MLAEAPFVITDGGSIQEECALLGVPTLLWLDRSERPDGIGVNVVVGRYDPQVVDRFLADPDARGYRCAVLRSVRLRRFSECSSTSSSTDLTRSRGQGIPHQHQSPEPAEDHCHLGAALTDEECGQRHPEDAHCGAIGVRNPTPNATTAAPASNHPGAVARSGKAHK